MKIGIVGLGRMGAAMSERLRSQGFEVVGWDLNADANEKLAADGLPIAANACAVPPNPKLSFPALLRIMASGVFSAAQRDFCRLT
jgi:6-phosphogluconate dehydrogenase (decarboxylating)